MSKHVVLACWLAEGRSILLLLLFLLLLLRPAWLLTQYPCQSDIELPSDIQQNDDDYSKRSSESTITQCVNEHKVPQDQQQQPL